jgi:hypothetical protein
VTSDVTDIFTKDNINIQCIWTGTLAGSFTVQTSDDYLPSHSSVAPPLNPGTWADLPLGAALANGVPDTGVFDLNELSARYLRVKFAPSGGAGNLTILITGKAI